jgi:DNA-binding transcriptional LysR family regulator
VGAAACGDDVLAPKLGQFARDYPEVVLDVTTEDSHDDLVDTRTAIMSCSMNSPN